MKEAVLQLLNSSNYTPATISEIFDLLNLSSSEEYKQLAIALVQLEDEDEIYRSKKDRYMNLAAASLVKGTLKIYNKGYGFLLHPDGDVFVSKSKLHNAFDEDVVLVQLSKFNRGASREGEVVKIIKRSDKKLVGLYQENKQTGYVILDNKKLNIYIDVLKDQKLNAVNGSKVVVEIIKQLKGNKYLGKVVEVIGHKNDPGIDILSTIYAHNIDIDFTKETMAYLNTIDEVIDKQELASRVDLRNELTFTIDGADAKDLDDAISLVKVGSNYKLSVHIADVSYYVKANTPLDEDAKSRATSVYLVDRVIPMLPHFLSNNICSLNPQVDRLTMTCEMEINAKGKVVAYNIFPSVICSNARLTYDEVNEMIDGVSKHQDEQINDAILAMQKLAKLIRQVKRKVGSLDFDVDEGKVIVDKNSKVIDVVLRTRKQAERLIEDFMVLANQTVASHFYYLDLPFIYRIHDKPKPEKISQFLHVAKIMGYKIKGFHGEVNNMVIKSILDEIKDEDDFILKTLLLRSMQKAVYDVNNIGHFGLALRTYTHFTSPIRRYPDLLVHRLIRKYLVNNDYKLSDSFIVMLEQNAMHSSNKERKAMECEFAVLDMKKAEYMEQFIGDQFEGIISSVTSFGMFVQLPNTIEGLVKMQDMDDDYYIFDDKKLLIYGKNKHKSYKLGQKISIIVTSTNKDIGEIDFVISR